MLKNERQEELLSLLQEQRRASVAQLAEKLYASPSSIRRDLTELESRGLVKRSYGCAEPAVSATLLPSYAVRIDKNAAAKKLMAEKAASLVGEKAVVFLDQSSSAYYLAERLAEKKGITVVTNNIEIAAYLSRFGAEVICTGGRLCAGNRCAMVGADAERVISGIHVQFAFFSSAGLSDSGEITDYQYEEISLKNAVFRQAERVVFLCDSKKLSVVSTYRQTDLSSVDILVCENAAARRYASLFPKLEIL